MFNFASGGSMPPVIAFNRIDYAYNYQISRSRRFELKIHNSLNNTGALEPPDAICSILNNQKMIPSFNLLFLIYCNFSMVFRY